MRVYIILLVSFIAFQQVCVAATEDEHPAEIILRTYGRSVVNKIFPGGLPKCTEDDLSTLVADLGIRVLPHQLKRFFLLFGSKVFPARTIMMAQGVFREKTLTFITLAWDQGIPREYLPFCEDNGDYYCLHINKGEVGLWDHESQTFNAGFHWPSFFDWIEKDWGPLLKR